MALVFDVGLMPSHTDPCLAKNQTSQTNKDLRVKFSDSKQHGHFHAHPPLSGLRGAFLVGAFEGLPGFM